MRPVERAEPEVDVPVHRRDAATEPTPTALVGFMP
jgi:hypothetical protein